MAEVFDQGVRKRINFSPSLGVVPGSFAGSWLTELQDFEELLDLTEMELEFADGQVRLCVRGAKKVGHIVGLAGFIAAGTVLEELHAGLCGVCSRKGIGKSPVTIAGGFYAGPVFTFVDSEVKGSSVVLDISGIRRCHSACGEDSHAKGCRQGDQPRIT